MMHRSEDIKDPIEVYFDNQIGIIEAPTYDSKLKSKKEPEVAEGADLYGGGLFDVLAVIAARNEQEAKTGSLIQDFAKIYRRYKALNRQTVGDYFFKETEDLVTKLCDDFEVTIRDTENPIR